MLRGPCRLWTRAGALQVRSTPPAGTPAERAAHTHRYNPPRRVANQHPDRRPRRVSAAAAMALLSLALLRGQTFDLVIADVIVSGVVAVSDGQPMRGVK